MLLERIANEVRHESALMIKRIEDEAKEEADKRARDIITQAIQRCAADQVAETTVSVVPLPNDELKGRIIGREGRNIKALEQATGVDVIIDDTPEAVTLSSFDIVRREIARITLERLISDGRIHPGRIEEMVSRVRKEIETKIREAGEEAVLTCGIHGLHPEEVKLLGRLKYRTSYGQNVWQHSIEVSLLAGLMASQLGLDIQLVKRAGLLHDLGKSVDHEVEGTHPQIGADLAKKYNENLVVVEAILNHHSSSQTRSILPTLIDAADAISASRPGARRETVESYVKRLEKLESIADSYPGVEKAYAIQAGREIRVLVKPETVGDAEATQLAREISKRIEKELEYPGQIKVTLIRETRVVDYAK
jgi:ribonuclease Y